MLILRSFFYLKNDAWWLLSVKRVLSLPKNVVEKGMKNSFKNHEFIGRTTMSLVYINSLKNLNSFKYC